MKDEIIEEIHRFREEYAAKFNYDVHQIFEDLRRRAAESEREAISLPPKRIEPVEETKKAA